MRNIVILNSLHFSYPLPILMRVSYNTLIVKQNTSDYYKYTKYISDFSALREINNDFISLSAFELSAYLPPKAYLQQIAYNHLQFVV